MPELHPVVSDPRGRGQGQPPTRVGCCVDYPVPAHLPNIATPVMCRGHLATVMPYEFFSPTQTSFPIRFEHNGVWQTVTAAEVEIIMPRPRDTDHAPARISPTPPRGSS